MEQTIERYVRDARDGGKSVVHTHYVVVGPHDANEIRRTVPCITDQRLMADSSGCMLLTDHDGGEIDWGQSGLD